MASARKNADQSNPKRPPARTPEEQENRMISLAVGLAEKQLLDGTASPTTINHFLKLATVREQREQEKLRLETKLLEARTEQIGSQAKSEAMYKEAIEAFRQYSGHGSSEDDYDD